ncbi:CPBP family intramembrane glutamic endopeptidase [Corynebacterium sp. TAE3-ERU30]|uniref:CPBP family intramembrane glutamic endopeptidase n=1 Tax=Corynebacterium sp. TAE3-ERU30 TaxID=2849496 RepID=UPI001C4414A0|nr:type II CAAX endopeptidase family protein [Corynebacterium sp. TAE3-ERU30]MBV7281850.1 CPBP family intramembrane metalloprotease [Corynebacterium sp. TAE3-ERU30]
MKTLSQRPLISCLGVVVIAILSLHFGGVVAGNPDINTAPALFAYVIPLIVALGGLWWLKLGSLVSPAGFHPKDLLRLGWPLFAVSAVFFTVNFLFMEEPTAQQSEGAMKRLMFLVLIMAATAFFEEVIFRGIVLQILLKNTSISQTRAVILAAVIFGLTHLANLTRHPELIVGTASQVFYTFSLGIFLGALMLRTKNLWVPAIGHMIFNVLGSYTTIYVLPGTPVADASIFAAILQLVLVSPLLIIGLRWLKKAQS